jgi:chromosome segregation ATPase
MESEKIEKRLGWLDELRRKDAEMISRLNERLSKTENQLDQKSKQFQDLSGEVAQLSGQMTRIHQFDEALSKHRKEVSKIISGLEERSAEREKLLQKTYESDHQETLKSITIITEELKKIEELDQRLDARQHEEVRLSREIDTLEKRVQEQLSKEEDRSRAIVSLEEAHNLDTRRVSELQAESTDLRTKIDSLRGLMDVNEDRVRRVENRIEEVVESDNQRRKKQAQWIEKQELKLVEFEKTWKEWNEQFISINRTAEELEKKMRKYDETHRNMEKTKTDLDKVVERFERRIAEISEMQRLAEDRLKQDWTTFISDDQKRWNTHKLTYEEQWREHTRVHEKIQHELNELEENLGEGLQTLSLMVEKSQRRILSLLSTVREWAEDVEPNRLT